MKYLIANWKSYKTHSDATEWMRIFTSFDLASLSNNLEIIICPSYPLIESIKPFIQSFPISLGAQDISTLSPGMHTGEVSGQNLSGLVKYVIIGHSERRENNKENDEIINLKIGQARLFAIKPIVCVNTNTSIDYDCDFVAYEPVEAIGSDHPASVDNVSQFKNKFKYPPKNFIYGGSVSSENASEYLDNNLVNGFLVGTHSLDPLSFYSLARMF